MWFWNLKGPVGKPPAGPVKPFLSSGEPNAVGGVKKECTHIWRVIPELGWQRRHCVICGSPETELEYWRRRYEDAVKEIARAKDDTLRMEVRFFGT